MIPNPVLDRSPDRGADQVWNSLAERRKTRRAALHWTVYVVCARSTHSFRTETRDISRDGFYCVIDRPVTPGERIECDIAVPTHSSFGVGAAAYLRCRAQVVRVEQTETSGHFGVACTIEDYRLVYGSAEQTRLASRSDAES
jgi:hypothetical protein